MFYRLRHRHVSVLSPRFLMSTRATLELRVVSARIWMCVNIALSMSEEHHNNFLPTQPFVPYRIVCLYDSNYKHGVHTPKAAREAA